jgi:signal transduction histidine kinase/ABC-type amino acid transport substrate-binding protein/CheY-like chemotaxis protein
VNRFLCLVTFLVLFYGVPLQANSTEAQKHIRVGIFPFEPINFVDNNGEAQGFNVDLLREIANMEGWSLSFVPGNWKQGLDRLQSEEIDLMVSVAYTPERAKTMDYTQESTVELWGQVFIRPDGKIKNISDLQGTRVGVMREDISGKNFVSTCQQLNVSCEMVEYPNFSDVFTAVQEGEIMAGVAPQHFGLRNAGDYGLVPSSVQFSPFSIYFTSKNSLHYQLLSKISSRLAHWKQDQNSFYYQRLSHWLGVTQAKAEVFPMWMLSSFGITVIAALLLLSMNLLLKFQVKKRTAELAQSNNHLKRSQKRYQNLIKSMLQPMALHEIICDADGSPVDYRFLDVNPAFEKLLGKPATEILGKRVLELLPNTENYWIEIYGNVALNREPVHFQDYSAELGRHFDISAYSPEQGQFAAIITDISVRINMEEERRRLDDQVMQTQKLDSLGVLAGGIAHDFNNILMAVLGHCELALRRITKESPAKPNLEEIKSSASKAADLANQMLAYSGKGKFVVEPHDFSKIVEEMEQMLVVSVSKKVVLRYEFAAHLPTVDADATQLRQIILNLTINASDAIGDRSGVVAISTGVMDCDQTYLSETWLDEQLPQGQYVFLEVADTGCGIDKETIKRIFEPFFSTKFTGRGLGMAAVLGIVRGHKGAIKIYSEVGKGTTFKVLFPATSKPAALFDSEKILPPLRESGLVLLVDDDETVRSIGRSMLEELGFSVVTANDGRDALSLYKLQYQKILFVLMDLTMPHIDGEQAFREMRRINEGVKVILSSGYNEQEVTQRFAGKGLSGFLKKPYQLSVLQEAIRKLLDS